MSMRSKYQLYVKMLQEVKYLEDISDLDLSKRHLHIEALPSNSFNQTEKDTFMRLKLRSIEGMLKDIRSDLKNEGQINDKIASLEALLNTLIILVQDKNVAQTGTGPLNLHNIYLDRSSTTLNANGGIVDQLDLTTKLQESESRVQLLTGLVEQLQSQVTKHNDQIYGLKGEIKRMQESLEGQGQFMEGFKD